MYSSARRPHRNRLGKIKLHVSGAVASNLLQCHDVVELELRKEMDVIEGAQKLLKRTLEQATEQVRRLRSTIYFMDRDLEDKHNVLKIDQYNRTLQETNLNLSIYHGFAPLDPS